MSSRDDPDYRAHFSEPEAANYYDKVAYAPGAYDKLLSDIEGLVLGEVVTGLRQRQSPIEYLDFACGTGRITEKLEQQVDTSWGLDINLPMLERAGQRLKRTTLLHGDLTADDSLAPGPFDLITTFRFVLNAQPELREAALTRLAGRLRNDESVLVFNSHANPFSVLSIRRLFYKLGLWRRGARNYLSLSQCRDLARRCGLRVERVQGIGLLNNWFTWFLPDRAAFALENFLRRIPGLHLLSVELIIVCRPGPRPARP